MKRVCDLVAGNRDVTLCKKHLNRRFDIFLGELLLKECCNGAAKRNYGSWL